MSLPEITAAPGVVRAGLRPLTLAVRARALGSPDSQWYSIDLAFLLKQGLTDDQGVCHA
jgi:hypothetical protein